MDGFHELFGTKYDQFITQTHPLLEDLYQTIVNRKGIKQLLEKQNNQGLEFYYNSRFKHMKQTIENISAQDCAIVTTKVNQNAKAAK